MSEESKKISFGFSKLSKKTLIVGRPPNKNKDEEKIQFIDCLEEKSIKILNEEIKTDKVLVIPLVNNKESKSNESISKITSESRKVSTLEKVPAAKESENVAETLDSLAAKEILEELRDKSSVEETPKIFAVPLTTNAPLGEKESTLDDYENIPVSDFGLAMLRGMGWDPSKGLGKNEKLVTSSAPVLRPKGMGLGADKVVQSSVNNSSNKEEELKLTKGGFVRIVAGSHKNLYGQIEGFDDESGRIFVKLSLEQTVVSFNEFMVQLVSKTEFTKNCKVINVKKYQEYKEIENENKSTKEPISIAVSTNNMKKERKSENARIEKSPKKQYYSKENSPSYKIKKTYSKSSHRSESIADRLSSDRESSSDDKNYSQNKKLHRNQTSSDDSYEKRKSKSHSTSSSYKEKKHKKIKRKHYQSESSSDNSSPKRRRHCKSSKSKNIKSYSSYSDSSPDRQKSSSKSKGKNSSSRHKERKRSHSKSSRRKH